MNCPRCESLLATFTLENTEQSATVCESCGYADISASHDGDSIATESWARALARLDAANPQLERRYAARTERVRLPSEDTSTTESSRSSAETLESAVSVATVLSGDNDKHDKTENEDATSSSDG